LVFESLTSPSSDKEFEKEKEKEKRVMYWKIPSLLLFYNVFTKAFRLSGFQRGKSALLMARYSPGSELRLGQTNANVPVFDQFKKIVFESTIDKTVAYLEENNKVVSEWFQKFLSELPLDDDKNFEPNIMNRLISSEATLFEFSSEAETSKGLSIKFSHVIEPWIIVSHLISAKEVVLEGNSPTNKEFCCGYIAVVDKLTSSI
jgi:hypothetical protein